LGSSAWPFNGRSSTVASAGGIAYGYGSGATDGASERKPIRGGSEAGRSGAVLSELLHEAAGEPLQVEMSAVRVLLELLGLLLKLLILDC